MGIYSRIHSVGQAVGQVAVLGGFLSGVTIAVSSLPGAAVDRAVLGLNGQFGESVRQIAQAGDTSCRQTNAVTGIYQQPDALSLSQGVLPAGQTVLLEVVGTGTGWSRVREPIVGWIEARYLTPPTPCTYAISAQARSPQASTFAVRPTAAPQASINPAPTNPAPLPQVNQAQPVAVRSLPNPAPSNFPPPNLPPEQSQVTVPPLLSAAPQTYPSSQTFPQPTPQPSVPQPNSVAVRPTVPPIPAIAAPRTAPAGSEIVATTCDVLTPEGLIVRRQPDLNSAGTAVLAPGTYNFRFTGATQTIGRGRLAYIVAPTQGWIQVLTEGGVSTLGGGRCG